MSKTTTSSRTVKRLEPLRPMSEAEVIAAALADPDAKPLTPDDFKSMKRIPRALPHFCRQLSSQKCAHLGINTRRSRLANKAAAALHDGA